MADCAIIDARVVWSTGFCQLLSEVETMRVVEAERGEAWLDARCDATGDLENIDKEGSTDHSNNQGLEACA